jgi:helix-turn-helix protein
MVTTSPASSIAADAVLGRLLNEHEAAAFLGYTTRALQNWRLRGGGPVFVKVSDRSIRYRHRDLVAWIEARLRTSTTDPGPTPNMRAVVPEPRQVLILAEFSPAGAGSVSGSLGAQLAASAVGWLPRTGASQRP